MSFDVSPRAQVCPFLLSFLNFHAKRIKKVYIRRYSEVIFQKCPSPIHKLFFPRLPHALGLRGKSFCVLRFFVRNNVIKIQLGFTNATLFTRRPVRFLSSDKISFAQPVSIGSILRLRAMIMHTAMSEKQPSLVVCTKGFVL